MATLGKRARKQKQPWTPADDGASKKRRAGNPVKARGAKPSLKVKLAKARGAKPSLKVKLPIAKYSDNTPVENTASAAVRRRLAGACRHCGYGASEYSDDDVTR